MIIIQTPLRISFFGGGTDFPSYFCDEGGCVLTTAINKYIYVIIKKRFDKKLRIGYTQTEMVDSVDEIQHELIREALRIAGIREGVEIMTLGDVPAAGSGLGSSSTVTVGALHAMFTYLNEHVDVEHLAQEACKIEIEILGKPIGLQDQYIAAYGGLKFIEFNPGGYVNVQKVNVSAEVIQKLNDNLLLFYTGVTRSADSVLTEQKQNISLKLDILREMKKMAYLAREELEKGNTDILGDLMDQSWTLKKQLATNISNQAIDGIYGTARKAGATGGKITGAGGGGFLLLYVPEENRKSVRKVMEQYQELPVSVEPSGSKTIFDYQR
jgi:D-glycero-alpha-D-manno-heptose-7-phosphate kinase